MPKDVYLEERSNASQKWPFLFSSLLLAPAGNSNFDLEIGRILLCLIGPLYELVIFVRLKSGSCVV